MFPRKRDEGDVIGKAPPRGYDWGRGQRPIARA